MRPRALPPLAGALLVLVALAAAPFRAPAASVQEASPVASPGATPVASPAATPQRRLAVVDEAYQATAQAAAATAAALATAQAGSRADLATAEARQAAAESTATALAATASAREAALAAESEARATAEADATRAAEAAAATGTARGGEATAAAATVAALGTAVAGTEDELATATARLEAARATAVGQEEARARAEAAAAAGLDPGYRVVSVQVDAPGVVAGDEAAIADARRALARALAPYDDDDCRVGVALTFGHAASIDAGVALAAAVNRLLPEAAPELFDGAALDAFGDLGPPPGQVDLRLYFFAGCPAAATPQAAPTT